MGICQNIWNMLSMNCAHMIEHDQVHGHRICRLISWEFMIYYQSTIYGEIKTWFISDEDQQYLVQHHASNIASIYSVCFMLGILCYQALACVILSLVQLTVTWWLLTVFKIHQKCTMSNIVSSSRILSMFECFI